MSEKRKSLHFANNPSDRLPDRSSWQRILICILLLLVFIATIQYKFYLLSYHTAYQRPDSVGAFWTEAAFHFRHARMVKDGIGIPALDKQIQYPEGIEIWKHCTPVMDWLYGTLYRLGLTMGLPFHQFVMKAQSIWSALSIFAIFLGGVALWKNRWGALLATIFYAFSLGFMDRGIMYLRENFALPLVWFFLALFLMAVRDRARWKNIWLSIGSASLLVLALASWHVTRFYFLFFIAGLVITQLPFKGIDVLNNNYFHNLRRALLIITSASLIAALFLPVLKLSKFLIAPSMMLGYGLLLCYYILPLYSRFRGKVYYFLSMILLISFFFISYALEKAAGLYSHVEELFKAKIFFLGMLPEDPNLVSFEAKVVWNGALVSPSPTTFLILTLPGLIVLGFVITMISRDWLQRKNNRIALMIPLLALFAICCFALVLRLHVLIHAPVAFLAARIGYSPHRKYRIIGICVLVGLICLQLFLLIPSKISIMQPNINVIRSLVDFIKKETPEHAVFASEFNLGPTIACDANRAVLVQSKFENIKVRKKIEELYNAMFESEDKLLAVCKKYGATYFVLGINTVLDTTKESLRYISGRTRINKNMVAYKMHFKENELRHFHLIFQNPNYRIFKIGDEPIPPLPPEQYWPIWDANMLGLNQIQSESIPDQFLKEALYSGTDVFVWLQSAERLKGLGRDAEAESLFMRAIFPAISSLENRLRYQAPDLSSLANLVSNGAEQAAQAYAQRGQNKEAAQVVYRAARPFALMSNLQQALELLDKAIMYDPENQQIMMTRDQLMKKMQRF